MDVKLEKWHKCQIDKEVLKELSKKSDLKGLQHVSVFFGLLLITGIFAYQTWGTWWSVFWFLVYKLKTKIPTTMYPRFDMQKFQLLIIIQKKLKHAEVLLNQISSKVLLGPLYRSDICAIFLI